MDEKYPGQDKATSVGYPPDGMWYDPMSKDAKSEASVAEALRYFIANPDIVGMPTHISTSEKRVYFSDGKTQSFDELISAFTKHSTEKDASFFDGPVDIGKEHDGDFPSVMWMPRGEEDLDVDDEALTASRKINAETNLVPELLHKAIELYVNTADIDWFDKYGERYVDYIQSEAEEHGKQLSPNVIDRILEEMDETTLKEMFSEDEVQSWVDALEGIYTEEALNETYPQILESYYKVKPKPTTNIEFTSALDTELPDEQKEQIAAKYGPEYISALEHYSEAIRNQHPDYRALEYAVSEMKKQMITIDPMILKQVASTYHIQ